jgi:xylulokinase
LDKKQPLDGRGHGSARKGNDARNFTVLEAPGIDSALLEREEERTILSPLTQPFPEGVLHGRPDGNILAVDVGTTGMKMGVFRIENDSLVLVRQFTRHYPINTYHDGLFSDIEPEKWQKTFLEGCRELGDLAPLVDVVSFSGTTPGFTAMDENGGAVFPAILMLDQRSREQARRIIETVGLSTLLETTGNMPVAGGCSLASLLWMRDNHPDAYRKVRMFGHSNTFMVRWLTGESAIDPSSASLTALYNTVANDLTWNADIARAFEIPLAHLPEVIPSHASPGRVKEDMAALTGLSRRPPVVVGGNDAVLAAYSVGIDNPGDIMNVNGTCEITLVCLPRCLPSTRYNIRAHVFPGRWLTLYVMNAGGKALEWFRTLFCREIDADSFYCDFLPGAIDAWLDRESGVVYIPYLMGSRYTQEPLRAEFRGLTHETSREEMLAALVRGLCEYQREHLRDVAMDVPLGEVIHVTGGAAGDAVIRAKRKWMRDCAYIPEEESSMKGAAMLGKKYLEG